MSDIVIVEHATTDDEVIEGSNLAIASLGSTSAAIFPS